MSLVVQFRGLNGVGMKTRPKYHMPLSRGDAGVH